MDYPTLLKVLHLHNFPSLVYLSLEEYAHTKRFISTHLVGYDTESEFFWCMRTKIRPVRETSPTILELVGEYLNDEEQKLPLEQTAHSREL